MAKTKKPAPKGGKKIAAPKKAAKAAPKKGRASNDPTPIEETNPPMPPLADAQQGRAWADLTERQADQRAADGMREANYRAANKPQAIADTTATKPLHPTVEEQYLAAKDAYAHTLGLALHRAEQVRNQKPAKRGWFARFRSAVTGLFVSKKYAEANPDTTVREKA